MQLALQLFTEPDSAAELLQVNSCSGMSAHSQELTTKTNGCQDRVIILVQDVIVCHEKANQKKKREGKLSDREANGKEIIESFVFLLFVSNVLCFSSTLQFSRGWLD